MERISELILRRFREELTAAEQAELDAWLDAAPENRQLLDALERDGGLQQKLQRFGSADEEAAWARFAEERFPPGAPTVSFRRFWWAAAAVLILLGGAAAYFLRPQPAREAVPVASAIVLPGTDKATLTLADGTEVELDSAGNRLIRQGGASVLQDAGSLDYAAQDNHAAGFHTLRTPRGGQYKIVLEDGSRVWLNAASSLRYPAAFTSGDRIVEVNGEAYFEVAHNAARPFQVKIGTQASVTVLGTRFNINAYDDETAISTTLVEGSVRVSSPGGEAVLRPGAQARVTAGGGIRVVEADAEQAIAWKNDVFNFRDADVPSVMRQLSRWYDVEVVYEGKVPAAHFQGEIQRDLPLQDVLEGLKTAGLQFRTEGRKIFIR
ncbi:FecR domain-containing protein [Chitinophaga lutea]